MSNINTHTHWLYRISLLLIQVFAFHKEQSKYNIKKILSRQDFVCLCQSYSKDLRKQNYPDDYYIGTSAIALLRLYGLDKTLSQYIFDQCCIAMQTGWIEADKILKQMAENGGAWSEKYFDNNSTSVYMSMIQDKGKITGVYDLYLICWFYKHGERLRVQYHTIPEFIMAFEKGSLYYTELNLERNVNEGF